MLCPVLKPIYEQNDTIIFHAIFNKIAFYFIYHIIEHSQTFA